MKRILFALLLVSVPVVAQQQATVAISKGPASEPTTTLTFYDASSNPQYICKARSRQNAFTWAVTPTGSQGTLTSIAVATNVGTVTTVGNHGLAIGYLVTVAGSTTSALNGTYIIQTVPSATTFTITTSGVSDGTYNTAALNLTTTAPRSSSNQWSIEKFTYNVGNNPTADQWAQGSTAQINICDNRTTIAYQ